MTSIRQLDQWDDLKYPYRYFSVVYQTLKPEISNYYSCVWVNNLNVRDPQAQETKPYILRQKSMKRLMY